MKLLYCFFRNKISESIILIMAAVFAMISANLNTTQQLYHAFLNMPIELRIGALDINKNMLSWINDALMALFFLLVGLEVKCELIQGALANRQRAAFPAIAALGGMIAPTVIYLFFNHQDPIAREGWAIPAATDIAFALGALALMRNRVPVALKVFLMTLAIIDDLGAIIIIALFYTSDLSVLSLSIVAGTIITLALLNMYNISNTILYILVGAILWMAVMKSGVHATLAGVIIGFFIPLKEREGVSTAKKLEYVLRPWVEFIILPLFAFANAGVSLRGVMLNQLISTVPLGIIFGLFIGKPIGISLFCWLSLKLKIASLATGTTFRQIMAVSILCGIGFTMSIFIASLAFDASNPQLIILAKLSILIGSLLAAFVGCTLLRIYLPSK